MMMAVDRDAAVAETVDDDGPIFFAVSTEGTGGWNGLAWKVCATKPTKLRSVDAVLFVVFVVIIAMITILY